MGIIRTAVVVAVLTLFASCGGGGPVSIDDAAERYHALAQAGYIDDDRGVAELTGRFRNAFKDGYDCDQDRTQSFVYALEESPEGVLTGIALRVAFCPGLDARKEAELLPSSVPVSMGEDLIADMLADAS